ncbi:helix-turn-helix domain-containing protein [Kribbella deserti]
MAAEVYARRGQGDVARQFLAAVGQMEAAAAQLSNEAVAEAVISVSGNAETEMTAVLGASELSTSEAAKRLGRTRERVVQMLNAGELLGRKVGRAWLVDAQSVDDVLEARRAA